MVFLTPPSMEAATNSRLILCQASALDWVIKLESASLLELSIKQPLHLRITLMAIFLQVRAQKTIAIITPLFTLNLDSEQTKVRTAMMKLQIPIHQTTLITIIPLVQSLLLPFHKML